MKDFRHTDGSLWLKVEAGLALPFPPVLWPCPPSAGPTSTRRDQESLGNVVLCDREQSRHGWAGISVHAVTSTHSKPEWGRGEGVKGGTGHLEQKALTQTAAWQLTG